MMVQVRIMDIIQVIFNDKEKKFIMNQLLMILYFKAVCSNIANEWYHLNDEAVTCINNDVENFSSAKQSYILMYERIDEVNCNINFKFFFLSNPPSKYLYLFYHSKWTEF